MRTGRLLWVLTILSLLATVVLLGQAPVGTISGTVYDESGAVVPNAEVTIKFKATGAERKLTSGADGSFSAPALAAGEYEVTVTMAGFRTLRREATVATGAITTVDARMQVGQAAEVVSVEAATAQIAYESHSLDGVVTRQKIQELPLNGRGFLNLAILEPGVRVNIGSTSQYNAQFSVSVLGADAGRTSYTVDGGNVRDSIESTGSGMNFSQEIVQEFQLSSTNFDLSTGITSVGSVNIVTRTGGNDFHGSGYFYFRDHNMAAYPGLKRNAQNPNPFFARRNPGFWVGGPVMKDRLFFFFNYEYQNQASAITVQPNLPSLFAFAGNYISPYKGKTLSARFDYRLNSKNQIFARYSHDGNNSIGPTGTSQAYPSNWVVNTNWSDQSLLGWTSTLKPTIVNDFRFSYQYWHNRNLFPTSNQCPGECIGGLTPTANSLAPGAQISINGSNLTVGDSTNATQGRDLRKFQFTDNVSWQKGSHRVRFGGEMELAPGTGFWGYCDPFCSTAAPPELIRGLNLGPLQGALFPNLPTTVRSYQDLLNLPFLGAVVGVGDPAQPPPFKVGTAKWNNRFRVYLQDTWKVSPRFTLNYGIAYNFESRLFNFDLTKPAFLAPVYGSNLNPTNNNFKNISPSVGFNWSPMKDNKTVIRGGFGIYYDTEYLFQRLQERAYIGPKGNGRVQFPNSGLRNIFPGIVNLSLGGVPVPVGANLPFGQLTNLTMAQFFQIYNQQIGAVQASLAPKDLNDLSVRNIDISKTAAQLYPKNFPVMRSLHFNIGVQRELRKDLVLSVDFARRVFLNTNLGEYDQNRFNRFVNGVQSPVIRRCGAAESSTPGVQCSNGPITFWLPGGRNVYNGLLMKLDKRFARRHQFTVSYALTSQHGYNGLANLDQFNASWGPQGARHVLNVSGIVELPWGFQVGLISSTYSVAPSMAFVQNVDLEGDGTTAQPLPGLSYNCLARGCGTKEVITAVDNWNSTYAGKRDARGQTISALALPSSFSFGRVFNSQDLRLTKTFAFKERYKIAVFSEMFNVLNYFNPTGFNFNLDQKNPNPAAQTFAFGIPAQRTGQVFGSGGPRALQVGARFTF